jgi:phosphate/sulfate permease
VAVAEIAAGLDLPVSVTKILLGDLIGAGLARARPPATFMTEDGAPDMALLQAVRDGLRKL